MPRVSRHALAELECTRAAATAVATAAGVIANMWAASWLLAVAWVACVTLSNGTLLWSIVRLRFLHSKASLVAHEIVRCDASLLEAVQADGGDVAAAASKPTPAVAAAIEARRAAGKHLRALRDAAEQIEGAALLYPAFHLGSLRGAWEHCLTSSAEGEEHQQAAARGAMPSPPESPRAVLAPAKNQCDTDHAVSRLLLSSTTPADGLAAAHAKRAAAQLADLRTRGTGRFVWRWRDWMHLQSHFELALVLKIVVIHLVTEAFRHAMTKPCTTRFWVTLLGVTGTVTCFLVFVVTSYSGKRLVRSTRRVGQAGYLNAHCLQSCLSIHNSPPHTCLTMHHMVGRTGVDNSARRCTSRQGREGCRQHMPPLSQRTASHRRSGCRPQTTAVAWPPLGRCAQRGAAAAAAGSQARRRW